jgi:O-antigen ligase
MKNILKYSILGGIYLLLIIPFIVADGMFFPYIVGKAFIFRIIVEILFGLWLIYIIKYNESRPKTSYIFYSVLSFIFVLLMASILAVAPYKSFWSNFERMEGFVTFAHLFAYFMILISILNTEKMWLWFLRLNITAGVIMAITSLGDGAKENIVRIAGPLGNPIYISVYFLFIFFFTLILLYKDVLVKNLTNWKDFKKVFANILFYVYFSISILSSYIVYRTSRGALLGLVGGILVAMISIAVFEKSASTRLDESAKRVQSGPASTQGGGKKVIRHIALGGIVIVLAFIVVFLGIRNTSYVKNNPTLSRLAQVSWSNVNDQARQLVWPMAIKGFKEKPILGYGLEGFNYVFNKHYDARMYNQETWFDRAHNAPLDFLVASGLFGFLAYLALFISAFYLLWFKRNDIDISEMGLLTGLLAGYLFQAIFVFDNLISYIMFFTILAYIHSRITEKQDYKNNNSYIAQLVKDEEYQNYILIPLIVIITTVGVWWVNIPAISANKTLISALRLVQENRFPEALSAFEKALSYKSLGDSEIREQLISSSVRAIKSETATVEIKQKFYNLTLDELEKQLKRVPNDARYYILTGSFLANVGNYKEAIPYIENAIKLSPQKQQMRFQLISVLYSLGRGEEALTEAKYTYDLEPNYEQAKGLYETLLKEVNK